MRYVRKIPIKEIHMQFYVLKLLTIVSGNERIHLLTQYQQTLHIYLRDYDGTELNMEWEKFCLAGESDNYRINVVSSAPKLTLVKSIKGSQIKINSGGANLAIGTGVSWGKNLHTDP